MGERTVEWVIELVDGEFEEGRLLVWIDGCFARWKVCWMDAFWLTEAIGEIMKVL